MTPSGDAATCVDTRRIKFTVFGTPIPKARPRCVRKNGKVLMYTPATTKKYEAEIAEEARQYIHPGDLLTGALRVSVHAFFEPPKAKSKRKILDYVSSPDIDNVIKSVLDALQGRKVKRGGKKVTVPVLYDNDSRVVEVWGRKDFGHPPRIEVIVEELGQTRITTTI